MTIEEVNSLVKNLRKVDEAKLIETHISWVVLTEKYAYKFKKTVKHSFLDYSQLAFRKFYCEREITLNSRFSDIYIEVIPVYKNVDSVQFAKGTELIDYGVKMLKMDPNLQMDILLQKGLIKESDIVKLGKKIAHFHRDALELKDGNYAVDIQQKFNDIQTIKSQAHKMLGEKWASKIDQAIIDSNSFIYGHIQLFNDRIRKGFIKDLHGDLHAGNIFIYEDPIIFDCIEFNDSFRQMDVISEIAFLCMDLEASDIKYLSDQFLNAYLETFPCITSLDEKLLLVFYKSYRANISAKVNVMSARQMNSQKEKQKSLELAKKYINLMIVYLKECNTPI